MIVKTVRYRLVKHILIIVTSWNMGRIHFLFNYLSPLIFSEKNFENKQNFENSCKKSNIGLKMQYN